MRDSLLIGTVAPLGTRLSLPINCGNTEMTDERGEKAARTLPQCYSVHHKSHMTWPATEQEPAQWEAVGFPPEPRPARPMVQFCCSSS
jgi:hypothetical protein